MNVFEYNTGLGAVTEEIDFAGDYDVYQVELIQGVDYATAAYGITGRGGTLQDPYIRIFDPQSRTLLYEKDDTNISGIDPVLGSLLNDALNSSVSLGSTSLDPSFTFQAPYTGTYDVVVSDVSGSSGSYTFSLDQAGVPTSLTGLTGL